MPTIDIIVKDALIAQSVFQRDMKRNGFDYQFLLSIGSQSETLIESPQKAWIEGIVTELVKNANKAIYKLENPYLSPDASLKKKPGRVELSLKENYDTYFISCKDNGCGIPKENYGLIFEPRFSTMGSSGLGLGYIKDALTELSGKIHFESEVGKGTTFHIEIPK